MSRSHLDIEDPDMLLSRLKVKSENQCRLTPYIITFCEGNITDIDIENFLEAGLRVVKFKMTHVAGKDKVVPLSYLKKAIATCCQKHGKSHWPVAISVDLPNACILTGYLSEEIPETCVFLQQNSIVDVTSDTQYWNQCDDRRIFIDDPHTLATLKVNTEISISLGAIVMVCTEVVNQKCIKCKVVLSGYLESAQFVCIRGIRYMRPPLAKLDRRLLEFAKENELDVITINSIREPETVNKVKEYFKDCCVQPFILCTICEQEGLNRLDEIIDAADGIVLARDFIALSITVPSRMTAIQLHFSAKCRQRGKPFYISGRILDSLLKFGTIACNEISDVTNAVLQRAGFVLRSGFSAANVVSAMEMLNEIAQEAEKIPLSDSFWDTYMLSSPPINAAEASILACAIASKQTNSEAVIVLTVTGWSAVKLTHLSLQAVILTVSSSEAVARRLQLYRGIIPIVYNEKGLNKNWYKDMNRRVLYGLEYALKHDLLKYGQTYVVLRKATPSSAFCDQVSTWKVTDEKTTKYMVICPDYTEDIETQVTTSTLPGPRVSSEVVTRQDIIYAPPSPVLSCAPRTWQRDEKRHHDKTRQRDATRLHESPQRIDHQTKKHD